MCGARAGVWLSTGGESHYNIKNTMNCNYVGASNTLVLLKTDIRVNLVEAESIIWKLKP